MPRGMGGPKGPGDYNRRPEPARPARTRTTRPAPRPAPRTIIVEPPYYAPPRRKPRRVTPVTTTRYYKKSSVRLYKEESLYFEDQVTLQGSFIIDSVEAVLYITSMRLILDAPRHGFNVKITEVDHLRKTMAGVEITINSQVYRLITGCANTIIHIIEDILETYRDEEEYVEPVKPVKTVKTTSSKPVSRVSETTRDLEDKYLEKQETVEEKDDPYEVIKKLKELLDMDIITEEEFERKKKQLLGI